MGALFAFLSSLPVILTVVFSIAKTFPRVFKFFYNLFRASRGGVFRSGIWGILISVLTFAGGFGLIVLLLNNLSVEHLAFVVDRMMSPFSNLINKFLVLVLSETGGCPNLPNVLSVFLGVLHLPVFVSIVVSSICCEVFLRFFIYFLIRRGK